MKLPLIKNEVPYGKTIQTHWRSAKPFVRNRRGMLVHRPKSVTGHSLMGKSWLAVHMLCGSNQCGSDKFDFVDLPGGEEILCKKCEEKAVDLGMPSADSIAGRHVCIGGLKAYKACCND